MYLSTKRYFSYRESAVPLSSAPEWDDTTGIQSLTAAGDRKLTASWNGAADPFGEQVAYRIYLRAGAAPDGFGKGGDYYLCETTGAGFDIACTPDGDALTAGTEYHAIVRAVSSAGYEDTNTVSLSATASDENADRLRKIDGVVQTILALSLS